MQRIYVQDCYFHPKSSFFDKFCLNWWKNVNKNIFYDCWRIVPLQQQVLIYGCLMPPMMFFILLLKGKPLLICFVYLNHGLLDVSCYKHLWEHEHINQSCRLWKDFCWSNKMCHCLIFLMCTWCLVLIT